MGVGIEREERDRSRNERRHASSLSALSLSLLSHQMAKICLRDTVFAGAVVFVVAVPPPEAGGILGKRRAGIGKKASGVFFFRPSLWPGRRLEKFSAFLFLRSRRPSCLKFS